MAIKLRVPQVRVLEAMLPPNEHPYPIFTRDRLGVAAGFQITSGTINRVLNGIPPGSSSGKPHDGLITLGYIVRLELDIDGRIEKNYQITNKGIKAYEAYVSSKKVPKQRSVEVCTNKRYMDI